MPKKTGTSAKKPKSPGAPKAGGPAAQISVWELDPGWQGEDAKRVTRPAPPLPRAADPLSYQIVGYASQPNAGVYKPTTAEFRYWNFVEAANRCLGLWRSAVPSGTD